MLKNAITNGDNNFIISILRATKSKDIEPSEEGIEMIRKYEKVCFNNLHKVRKADKQTRNECFKFSRECKQWLKHFNIYTNDKKTVKPSKQTKLKRKVKKQIGK